MEREILSIKRKALRINLDGTIYGTFAEIGAGQEVARTFFQVGGASQTIAKTMSAYDMAFSDSIYGVEEGGRYVSESRLRKMLDHEFELLEERLIGEKYANKRFFAFAATCSTLNYHKNNDPHAWLGVRFQLKHGGPINEVSIHIRLKGTDSLYQQKVIGGIGVNLIFASYWYHDQPDDFIESLLDNLSTDQAEIDMIRMKGEDLPVDNRLLALSLVKKGFTDGTIFGPDKLVYQPKDVLYKKDILCLRGRFRPITKVNEDMLHCGLQYMMHKYNETDNIAMVAEITLNHLEGDGDFNNKDFLDRADILCSLGYMVMVSNCRKHDMLVSYLDRCRPKSVNIIVGIMNLIELFNTDYYENAPGDLLHYFGHIFEANTRMLVYPYQPLKDSELITTNNLKVDESIKHLFIHLKANGYIVDLEGYNKEVLQIFSPNVIEMIKTGTPGWEQMVPDTVADIIKDNCLFEYPCEVIPGKKKEVADSLKG
jgi:hypothetical protein